MGTCKVSCLGSLICMYDQRSVSTPSLFLIRDGSDADRRSCRGHTRCSLAYLRWYITCKCQKLDVPDQLWAWSGTAGPAAGIVGALARREWLAQWLSLRTLTLTVTIQDDLSGGHEGLLVWVLTSAGTNLSAGLSPYLSSDIVQAVEQTSASTWTVCTHEHSTRASGKTARFC